MLYLKQVREKLVNMVNAVLIWKVWEHSRQAKVRSPYVGKIGERHEENEIRIEVIFPGYLQHKIIQV